ncbi:MAG TPA: FkbM family methyltransferase [Chthoniobacterales bacterium]|jgi:FkbM family methyltransferase|nr:FkbM family methyltransferase [Chthoniobacterales bacterium]
MNGPRKLLKCLLPFGVVEMIRSRRRLRELGRDVPVSDLWRSVRLINLAEVTGLVLLPAGQLKALRWVVDVGANVGEWSSALLELVSPEKLIVIEPGPAVFARAREKLGGKPNVELHNVAIGETNGVTTLRITRDSTGASILPPREEMKKLIGSNWTVESEVECPIRTLDSLLAGISEVSLLKIDVQGYEKEALAGAAETLAKTKFVLIELNYMPQYEGGSWFGEIHELLTQRHDFVLVDATKPLRLNGRASMSDAVYVNEKLVPNFAPLDFV